MATLPSTSLSPASHSRREQWRVILPAGFGMAFSLAGDLTLYAILPAYASALAFSLATVGLLLSANRLVRLGSNSIVGLLADRFSRRSLVLTGLTTGVISTLLYVAAANFGSNFWMFLLGRVLWGISWSIMYIGIYCMIIDITGPQDRGWGSGVLQTFYFAGLAFTPLAGGLLSNWLGFSSGLLACAAIQLIGLAGAAVFLPETHIPALRTHNRSIQNLRPRDWLSRLRAWLQTNPARQILRQRELLSANYVYLLIQFVSDGIIMSTISLYLKQHYGDALSAGLLVLPVTAAGGALLAMRAVISAGAAPLAGRWADYSGQRWAVTGWGTLITTVGCGLLALDGTFGMTLAGVALAAFGSGMAMAVLPAIASSAVETKSGFAIGLLNTSGDIGCAIAPLAGYALLGRLSLPGLYLISGGLLATGLFAVLRAARGHSNKFQSEIEV